MKTFKEHREQLTEARIKPAVLDAINKAPFDFKTAMAIVKATRDIISKEAKGKDWKIDEEVKDGIGLTYLGDDVKLAQRVRDKIYGEVYGYFIDAPMKKRPVIKKISDMEFKVHGTDGIEKHKPQISFFRRPVQQGQAVFGLITSPYKFNV